MKALWLITLFSFQTKKLFSFVELDLIEHTKTASKYSRWNQLCSARKVNNYNLFSERYRVVYVQLNERN